MQQRHDLRARRGAGRVQDQRHVVRTGGRIRRRRSRALHVQRERPRGAAAALQAQNPQPELRGGGESRSVIILVHDKGLRPEVFEVELVFLLPVGGVQGRGRGGLGDGHEGRGHFRPVRQDDGDAVRRGDALGAQVGPHRRRQGAKPAIVHPLAARRSDRRQRRIVRSDEVSQGLRHRYHPSS